MKEATGDMTMTVVVILGAVAILALAPKIWNVVANKINKEVNQMSYVEEIDDYNMNM